jgi:hypothetical protein
LVRVAFGWCSEFQNGDLEKVLMRELHELRNYDDMRRRCALSVGMRGYSLYMLDLYVKFARSLKANQLAAKALWSM